MIVQITIYRMLLIGRDGLLYQSEAYDISQLVRKYGPYPVQRHRKGDIKTAGCTELFGASCSKVSSFLSYNSSSKILCTSYLFLTGSNLNCAPWPTRLWPVDSQYIFETRFSHQWSRSAECSTGQSRGRQKGIFSCWTWTLKWTCFRNSLCENTK